MIKLGVTERSGKYYLECDKVSNIQFKEMESEGGGEQSREK